LAKNKDEQQHLEDKATANENEARRLGRIAQDARGTEEAMETAPEAMGTVIEILAWVVGLDDSYKRFKAKLKSLNPLAKKKEEKEGGGEAAGGEGKPSEEAKSEAKPTEAKPAEEKPTEGKPAEKGTVVEEKSEDEEKAEEAAKLRAEALEIG